LQPTGEIDMGFITTLKNLFAPDLLDEPEKLRQGVRESYSGAAVNPGGHHPFPVGDDFAAILGYPRELLEPSRSAVEIPLSG
jgi:hypothetical protein